LEKLPALEGNILTTLPETALSLYVRLSKSFNTLLKTEFGWGKKNEAMALYKIVFANLSRLDLIRKPLARSEQVRKAAEEMEGESKRVSETILALACGK
jgi:hypothetical protein